MKYQPQTNITNHKSWILIFEHLQRWKWVNSLRPGDPFMRQSTWSSQIKEMHWFLFSAKPLLYPQLIYHLFCPLDYPNGPEAGREAGWGSEFVPLKKHEVGSFILLYKISRTACCFGIRTSLKQNNCYESATIWYTDHWYLAQYSEIINNLQEMPLIFCNYAVHSCGNWRKGPGQSPCNVLSISD